MIDQRTRTKVCSTCDMEKSVQEFSRNGSKLRSNCKECARISKSDWYKRHKSETKSRMQTRRVSVREYVQGLKAVPCVDCGQSFHHSLMDFDHLDPETKSQSVSTIASQWISTKKVDIEVAKCDPVCCMCHRVRSWNRMYPDNPISL